MTGDWQAAGLSEHAVLSGDRNRAQLGNDRRRQDIDHLVWRRVHRDLADRLSIGLTTVVDGTNLTPQRRTPIVEIARAAGAQLIAVRFDVPLETLRWHNAMGPEHERVPDDVLVRHRGQFDAHCSVAELAREADLVVSAGLRMRFERDYDPSAWDRL